MSDPVSSMDVEDVLSSIRRLVSEEAKGAGPHGESGSDIASSGLHETAEYAANDALAEIVQAVEGGSTAGIPPSNDDVWEDMDDEEGENGEFSDAEGDMQVSFRHKATGSERRGDGQKLVLTAAFRVADPEAEPETDIDFDASEEGYEDQSASDLAEAENASPHPHLRPVADLTEETAEEDAVDEEITDEDNTTGLHAAAFSYSPEDVLFDRAQQAMDAAKSGDHSRQGAALAEPELTQEAKLDAAQFESVEASEDVSPASPFSATGGAFEQVEISALEAEEMTEKDSEDDDEPSTINFAEEDASILDEETLRDLVSDMVREELQGELGDRITRNVRKLVRREIQRAIASREFE